MTPARKEAFKRLLDSQTHWQVDRQRSLIALQASRESERSEVMDMIRERRTLWLNYLSCQQRKWQSHTKNVNKAIHHDSISIREKYVRCQTQ
jgi:hypothetical protein